MGLDTKGPNGTVITPTAPASDTSTTSAWAIVQLLDRDVAGTGERALVPVVTVSSGSSVDTGPVFAPGEAP
jgi:hypothetical protein